PSQAHGVFDRRRRRPVHVDPRPDLDLVRPSWLPDAKGAGGSAEKGEVGEHRADGGVDHAQSGTQALLHFRADLLFVCHDLGHRRVTHVMGARRQNAVAVAGRDDPPSSGWSGTPTGTKAGSYRREVTPRHVVPIATEILGGKLPVTRYHPPVHTP